MQQAGVAPVRFILFPGAGHGPTKLSHRKRKMNEELGLDRPLPARRGEGDQRGVRWFLCYSRGDGELAGVWDLAGNVAEWTVTEDGKGTVLGLSAVTPQDNRLAYVPPPPGYTEFRVIED